MTSTTKRTWTNIGNVRGACGHKHTTTRGAVRCLARDQAGCARQGGYSDRCPVASDGTCWDYEAQIDDLVEITE